MTPLDNHYTKQVWRYKAFISYSHAADGKLAPALQAALHRFAKPWYKLRAIRIFRDDTSLGINPGLWSSIERALAESEYFLLLASPQAAQSKWVWREVDYWLKYRSSETLLLILTDGNISWDESAKNFHWENTSALPKNLSGVFAEEPRYIDLSWARTSVDLSLKNSRFADQVADIAAPLHHCNKDEIIGEDVHQYRKTRRIARVAKTLLLILTTLAICIAYVALQQQAIATARELAAHSVMQLKFDPELSLLLAIEATHWAPVPEVHTALRLSLLASHVKFTLSEHTDEVTWATFSRDGRFLVTTSRDTKAVLWNTRSGKPLRHFVGHTGRVRNAAFNPEGTLIVTASDDGTSKIWDVSTAKLHLNLSHDGWVRAAEFSPDGRYVVTASDDQAARIWEIPSGTTRHILFGHTDKVRSARFSSTGTLIVTSSDDSTARVWRTATGQTLHVLKGHKGTVHSAVFSPNERFIATAGADGTAVLWNLETGKEAERYHGHVAPVVSIDFSPDNNFIVTSSQDGTARIWETQSGKQSAVLHGHMGQLYNATFSPNGRFILTAGDDRSAQVWDAKSGQNLARLYGHVSSVNNAVFSPDGTLIATVSDDYTAKVWQPNLALPLLSVIHGDWVLDANFSPDERTIATAGADGKVRTWDTSNGKLLREWNAAGLPLYRAFFTTDSKYVIAVGAPSVVLKFEDSIDRSTFLQGHAKSINDVQLSPDGTFFVTVSDDHTARIWETASGKSIARLTGHARKLTSVTISNDCRYVVTTSEDKTARIWDAKTGSVQAVLSGHTAKVNYATFTLDGRVVATASDDHSAALWDTRDGSRKAILHGHSAPVNFVTFSPDGQLVITTSDDQTARLWQVQTGAHRYTLRHTGWVSHAGFDAAGSTLTTASRDGSVRVWEVQTGLLLSEFQGHDSWVYRAKFNRDGHRILTASKDGKSNVYECEVCRPYNELVTWAKTRATRGLTLSEQQTYLHRSDSAHVAAEWVIQHVAH